MMLFNILLPRLVKPLYLLVMLSYVPPFVWFLVTGQGIYQHGYHLLLVLLASGVATGAAVRWPLLATFLLASMLLNLLILLLDAFGLRLDMGISLGALLLLALSVIWYYAVWVLIMWSRWRAKKGK
ncbi:hypothetical protein CWE09_08935 [Aliidiomarina minuta]|uniref:Uncharacterized protein n=1 Tax=Aliidiomarina minuta TaxID=880057 RepID=A0A432W9M2_9GAMM|nr:hypothetical protein [Aliidiomarina minuta]RUO26799.1 hypothetical protein CWE09_08935 [Aliidiomarina minuta]